VELKQEPRSIAKAGVGVAARAEGNGILTDEEGGMSYQRVSSTMGLLG